MAWEEMTPSLKTGRRLLLLGLSRKDEELETAGWGAELALAQPLAPQL